ncbi:MAG TPA: hypothetical protein VHZ29_11805 [Rhizomicrobium sp.]|nr:hypothetical protein [Rhizomicrobium sp.]
MATFASVLALLSSQAGAGPCCLLRDVHATSTEHSTAPMGVTQLNGRVYIAWTDGQSSKVDIALYDTGTGAVAHKLSTPQTSAAGVSLASWNDALYVSWPSRSGNIISIAQVRLDAKTGAPTELTDLYVAKLRTHGSTPILVAMQGHLFVLWCGTNEMPNLARLDLLDTKKR